MLRKKDNIIRSTEILLKEQRYVEDILQLFHRVQNKMGKNRFTTVTFEYHDILSLLNEISIKSVILLLFPISRESFSTKQIETVTFRSVCHAIYYSTYSFQGR